MHIASPNTTLQLTPASAPPSERGRRIVLTTSGSMGDLHPYLAVARVLQTRGHQVVVAAPDVYRDKIEALGITFHPLRPHLLASEADPDLHRRYMDPIRGPKAVWDELVVPSLQDSYADTLAAANGADLLVSHPLTMTTRLVAEKQGIPWASTCLAPMSFFSPYDPPVLAPAPGLARLRKLGPAVHRPLIGLVKWAVHSWARPWHRLRADLGLPAASSPFFEGQHSPQLVAAMFSEVLGRPQPDWPATARLTGFAFYDEEGGPGLAPELARFLEAGPPPIVFTLGSTAVGDPGPFYQDSAEAAARLGRRAVLLVGWAAHNAPAPSSLPPGVLAVPYAPFADLFQQSAAIVHSGGVGTVAQALRAGRPMLVVPFFADQPDNAARAARLGVARVLPRKRYNAARATAELRALLEDPRYSIRAAEVAQRVRVADGAALAADALESLVRDRAQRSP